MYLYNQIIEIVLFLQSSSYESEDGIYSNSPTMNRTWLPNKPILDHNSSVVMREETRKTTDVQNTMRVHERFIGNH